MAREKILVVDTDLDSLSRIYLALVHRKFKTEACNNPEEITARLKRFRPFLIILGLKEYAAISGKLKIPAIILTDDEDIKTELSYGDVQLKKPVHVDELIKIVERMV